MTASKTPLTLLGAFAVLLTVAACEREGPAERLGQRVDRAAENVRDAVDPPRGPAERVGRTVDRAVD